MFCAFDTQNIYIECICNIYFERIRNVYANKAISTRTEFSFDPLLNNDFLQSL